MFWSTCWYSNIIYCIILHISVGTCCERKIMKFVCLNFFSRSCKIEKIISLILMLLKLMKLRCYLIRYVFSISAFKTSLSHILIEISGDIYIHSAVSIIEIIKNNESICICMFDMHSLSSFNVKWFIFIQIDNAKMRTPS